MLYSLAKPLLFALDPELAHDLSLKSLRLVHPLLPRRRVGKPVQVMGLEFPNAVGLAAGLDKNADYLGGLSKLGFGFIEVGSVTPKPQPGNPKPRIFRLSARQSLINRMGFNNAGVDHLLRNVGEGPRDLQNEAALEALLAGIGELRRELEDRHQQRRPLVLKLSPDLDQRAIPAIAELLRKYSVDGLIATNTTIDRDAVQGQPHAEESGGLSGLALRDKSREILSAFYRELQQDIPIISVGGIDSAEEAKLRLELGAKLVQVYTGLIYRGPGLVSDIARALV